MATLEDFEALILELTTRFQLASEKLHDHVATIFIPTTMQELARITYTAEENGIVGVSFHIEIIPTDAIQVFSVARHCFADVKLHQCFYQNQNKETFHGVDAQVMMEHDRENRYLKILEARTKAQQEEEFQLKQMEKAGKVTFH